MIIPEVAPMLTCTASNDGFLYELAVRAQEGQPAITTVRIGPYYFRHDYKPQPFLFGLTRGGPESGFWIHKSAPRGWSRMHWEIADSEPDGPVYLASSGTLAPGTLGLFRFVSMFPPGGIRAGLEISRGGEHKDYGVSGPNYEKFFAHAH